MQQNPVRVQYRAGARHPLQAGLRYDVQDLEAWIDNLGNGGDKRTKEWLAALNDGKDEGSGHQGMRVERGGLVTLYREIGRFAGLAHRTKEDPFGVLDWTKPLRDMPLDTCTRGSVAGLRNKAHKPSAFLLKMPATHIPGLDLAMEAQVSACLLTGMERQCGCCVN
ncbi:hypothetical protein [Microvirga rosea]|uniref:hypothetical protein n=1 Tax=Microvirga rosea TaxID=2715425 RepID=UPI001D0A7B50|nr:hypothetical protein [Microvirga rosea]MCB8819775.1 hypothetical protein [Microvirga rosea]